MSFNSSLYFVSPTSSAEPISGASFGISTSPSSDPKSPKGRNTAKCHRKNQDRSRRNAADQGAFLVCYVLNSGARANIAGVSDRSISDIPFPGAGIKRTQEKLAWSSGG